MGPYRDSELENGPVYVCRRLPPTAFATRPGAKHLIKACFVHFCPQAEIDAKLAMVRQVKSRYAWSGLYASPPLSDGQGRPDAVATLMAILHQRALRHDAMGVQRGRRRGHSRVGKKAAAGAVSA